MSPTEIVLRGVTMHLYEYEAVSEAIRRAGDFYEAEILDDLRARLPEHDSIVDAGANIGNHSLYWSAFVPHRRLYAFEPIRENYALLRRNLGRYPRAQCIRLALSDAPGYLRVARDPVNMGRCHVTPRGDLRVACTTVDVVAARDNVTLLKIDVEGHEREVLIGAQGTLRRCRPAILVEDEFERVGSTLFALGLGDYHRTKEWPGSNYLWEWAG